MKKRIFYISMGISVVFAAFKAYGRFGYFPAGINLLREVYQLEARAAQQNADEGEPPVSLPNLPYAVLSGDLRKDQTKCVENARKFSQLFKLTGKEDIDGYCTCLQLTLGELVRDEAKYTDGVQFVMRGLASKSACKSRHGISKGTR